MLSNIWKRPQSLERNASSHYRGLDLLRCLFCIVIVCVHFFPKKENASLLVTEYQKLYDLAVPVFMLISFFLLSVKLSVIKGLLKKRCFRLLYPQLVWTVVFFLLYSTTNAFGISNIQLNSQIFFLQLFLGHSFYCPMWFVVDCAILTILFITLYRVSAKIFSKICFCVIIISFALQYFDVHYILFGNLRYELCYPLGRLIEMAPYAFAGYLLSHVSLKKSNSYLWGCLLFITLILIHYNSELASVIPVRHTFGYSGLLLFIEVILIVVLSLSIPSFLKIKKENFVSRFICNIAKYSFGIYILHTFIGNSLLALNEHVGISIPCIPLIACVVFFSYLASYILGSQVSQVNKI